MTWSAESHFKKAMWLSVGVMALALIEGHAAGQCVEHKILATDGSSLDRFGNSVSITGTPGNEVAIVGAVADDDNGTDSGSAYIFRKSGSTWVQEAKLLATDGAVANLFGNSVSISGTPGNEVAIVGAKFDDDNGLISGSAYIFRKSGATWVQEAKLLASDSTSFDVFGISVSITGTPGKEVAIIGAYHDDDNGSKSGSAYIFHKNGATWVEEAKLLASDGAEDDFFGRSVSISGPPGNKVAIVGAPRDNFNSTFSGSAYIYRKRGETWVQEAKLLASDGSVGDSFGGTSVSISGLPGNEVAIVGAWLDDYNGSESGSAYIFRKSPDTSGWVQEAKLLASDGVAYDRFGISVSISGPPGNKVAIVGAPLDDDNGSASGSAYIFRKNPDTSGWVQEAKLLASDGALGDLFGISVSITGASGNEAAIVGARFDTGNASASGSAYVFELTCGPACPADLNGDGIVDVFDLIRVIHALFTRGEVAEDLDGDGVVTFRDMLIVIQSFGSCDDLNPETCPADLNGDGIVDVPDLLLLLGSWGPCSTPCPSDLNGDGAVNVSDFLQLLAAWGPCP